MAVTSLSLTPIFEIEVRVDVAQELGEFAGGRRRVVPILGGDVFGPRLNGQVLPGGADWQTIRADGVTLVRAQYTIQADDGAVIGVINTGVRRATPEITQRMAAGEVVDASQYYFRATPVFEVGPGPHAWLVGSVFIVDGVRLPDRVLLKFYELG
jgi:hypothetical protein